MPTSVPIKFPTPKALLICRRLDKIFPTVIIRKPIMKLSKNCLFRAFICIAVMIANIANAIVAAIFINEPIPNNGPTMKLTPNAISPASPEARRFILLPMMSIRYHTNNQPPKTL